MAELIDRFGRVARDMRVSLTDRCNLRCVYCMPETGVNMMPASTLLTDDEVIRLVRIGVEKLGISKVRFTGGEPLLRRGLEDIIAATARMRVGASQEPATGVRSDSESAQRADSGADMALRAPEIALTTNGIGLAARASRLKSAGLNRVNISIDTVQPAEYAQITRRGRWSDVAAGVRAARAAGLAPVKINAVIMRGINEHAAPQLLAFALRNGAQVRFIEFMPIGPRGSWGPAAVIRGAELVRQLREDFSLSEVNPALRGSAPAALWNVAAGSYKGEAYPAGQVGFISSVSDPFCAHCNRTRLTADGLIRSCLFSDTETNVRELLRIGASDAEIAAAWQARMWAKPEKHGIGEPEFVQPERSMSAIGG
ncbi:MAG: GTP 3',8-cyclase MoaA [Arcanobacterium sp.]|nr:GTP 3',8-cyclase MoaA [Arcanobacterium sp.]